MTDTVSGSYFASLAKARYLLLTTFKRKGPPVSAAVPGSSTATGLTSVSRAGRDGQASAAHRRAQVARVRWAW